MKNISSHITLASKTSFRIGGTAQLYCELSTADQIVESVEYARHNGLQVLFLGKGSNVLISDAGWPGLVINVSEHFSTILWNGLFAICEAGALLHEVVWQAVERGFGGIEHLAGIPGTVGGGIIMNAGAFDQTISQSVVSVDFYDFAMQKTVCLKAHELDFGYRHSALQNRPGVVLSVTLCLAEGNPQLLQETYRNILVRRKEKQPLDLPNCGSVFKRPPGNFAGTLIESSGLKGYRIGDAQVSEKHANFIVNLGNATANDVRRLIIYTQKTVYEKSGILLEPEVVFVGEFEDGLFRPE